MPLMWQGSEIGYRFWYVGDYTVPYGEGLWVGVIGC